MPWHKVRVYYDREAENRKRALYRLNVSVIVAGALMVVMLATFLLSIWAAVGSHRAMGIGGDRVAILDLLGFEQKFSGFVALLCFAYIAFVMSLRKP